MGGKARIPYLPIIGEGFSGPQRWENMNFLWQHMGMHDFETRVIKNIDIQEDYYLSGDLLLLSRFDGLEPLTMVSSGSHVGHAAMALWEDDVLYVIESVDAWQFSMSNNGVQKHLYKDWLHT